MSEKVFGGGKHTDNRGSLHFFNELDLNKVKRMYILEHPDSNTVRAWQGHKFENKWFFVISGSFKIILVEPDDWLCPSEKLNFHEHSLNSASPQVLFVPGGYATGFKAGEPDSKMIVFSDLSLEESQNDDYRFEKDKWYNWSI